eukprot:9255390-Karenia_brevis.AAC.1
MADHGLSRDQGVFVDKAQEDYVDKLGLGTATFDLSKQCSEWSATATVVLASKIDNTLAEMTNKMGYGQRAASFQEQMYPQMQSIQTQQLEDDPTVEDKADMALHVLKTATAVGIDLWSP